jgi:GntR family transcriptional regulator of vanillate catabolism
MAPTACRPQSFRRWKELPHTLHRIDVAEWRTRTIWRPGDIDVWDPILQSFGTQTGSHPQEMVLRWLRWNGEAMQLAQAVMRIREMILRGDLRAGDRVAEAPLADRLGTSRTPIRQALPLLAQEGLLAEHITRGYVVRGFTAEDINEALALRGVLEGTAVRRAAERGLTRATRQGLRACLEEIDGILAERSIDEAGEAAYAEANARFHGLMVADGIGRILADALARIDCLPFAASQAVAFDRPSLDRVYDLMRYAHRQHHVIVEALERGEAARAEALVREHALTVGESISMGAFELQPVAASAAAPAHLSVVK